MIIDRRQQYRIKVANRADYDSVDHLRRFLSGLGYLLWLNDLSRKSAPPSNVVAFRRQTNRGHK